MKIIVLLLFIFPPLFITSKTTAQCPAGTIGVSGSGCGCLSGCNLTSSGGPNCGGGTTGDCDAGQINMVANITIPAGCTYTVAATMRPRTGCSSSGGDANDKVKVDIPTGSKGFQSAGGNATLNDSHTLTGPGTIRVSGSANRADEIITYTTTSTGCTNCTVGLPVELMRFEAVPSGNYAEIMWETGSEINSDFFTVERSADGFVFEPIATLKAAGTTNQLQSYKIYDTSPLTRGYYRLRQTDLDGTFVLSEIQAVMFGQSSVNAYPNPSTGSLTITARNLPASDVQLFDAMGVAIQLNMLEMEEGVICRVSGLSNGLYVLVYPGESGMVTEKIMVTGR
jgi:hypothetical protein